MQIIEHGVTAGETIALDGIQRLRSGSTVSVRKVS